MSAILDMSGQQFGRLTVIEDGGRTKGGRVLWRCRCGCGAERTVDGVSLRRGHTRSCGCLQRETTSTHGRTESPEYKAWKNMRKRCGNPKHRQYPNYGGRGITVCQRWQSSFEAFLADMGERPSPAHSIDRINNDGNYEPGNCRWATTVEQHNNKRTNRYITAFGKTQRLTDWASEIGIAAHTLRWRLRKGWSVETALSTGKTLGRPGRRLVDALPAESAPA